GVLHDEYLRQEQDDAVEVIAWLAAQRWCNGAVGMRGISWGGFNALQVAALAPPALKAVMPFCFSDRRFTDDAHYVGGALYNPNYGWGLMFKTVLIGAPDPAIVGDRWRTMWQQRLDATPPILAVWTRHQREDAYWQHASVARDYDGVKCPVYAVGGLTDYYINAVTRTVASLKVPRKCLVGPWGHNYPNFAIPGPGLDWIHEEVRWWHHWLYGVETGIMNEPMFRAYLEYQTPVEAYPKDVPGRWIAEQSWPSTKLRPLTFYLAPGALAAASGGSRTLTYKADRIVGLLQGEAHPFSMPEDLPKEQSPDDAKSLVFDSTPLESDVEVLGNPIAAIRVAADRPVAKLALRLNEVMPDGQSRLVTWGLLNLTHRDGHEHPAPLEPGKPYDVRVQLNFIAHRFKRGSRIRLALSENLWPLIWPSPEIVTLTVSTGASSLALPVRPVPPEEAPFPIPMLRDAAPPTTRGRTIREQTGPNANGLVTIRETWLNQPRVLADIGTTHREGWTEWTFSMREGDPLSCRWSGGYFSSYERGEWETTLAGDYELTATKDTFRLRESANASEHGKPALDRHWDNTIARDLE
ncbi:MAG TPA: CocE/NonD family hydrolase, partial [Stellaceae bacterium]|nr:CocE/NonD family hydrolase [Stellaceae bacterium]